MPLFLPRLLAALLLAGALVLNALANALPLGGRTTGELSSLFPNLVVPVGLTFSIWGVIYLLVGSWAVVQFLPAGRALGTALAGPFALSSVLNAGWLLAWHHLRIPLSMGVMLGLLGTLLVVNGRLAFGKTARPAEPADPDPEVPTPAEGQPASGSEGGAVRSGRVGSGDLAPPPPWVWGLARAAFGIYLGWILVATLVNATVVLVDAGWDGRPLPPEGWASAVLVVGAAVAVFVLTRFRNPWVAPAVAWGYVGVALNRWDDYRGLALLALLLAGGVLLSMLSGRFGPRPEGSRGRAGPGQRESAT